MICKAAVCVYTRLSLASYYYDIIMSPTGTSVSVPRFDQLDSTYRSTVVPPYHRPKKKQGTEEVDHMTMVPPHLERIDEQSDGNQREEVHRAVRGNTTESTIDKEEQDDEAGTRALRRAVEVRTMIR